MMKLIRTINDFFFPQYLISTPGHVEQEKFSLLTRMSEYRPSTTVLEFGKDPVSKTAALMRHKRKLHEPIIAGFKRKREEVILAKKAGNDICSIKMICIVYARLKLKKKPWINKISNSL